MKQNTASQEMEVLTSGVLERSVFSDPLDRYAEEVLCRGSTVVPNVFSAREMDKARDTLDAVYASQKETFGADKLEQVHDVNIVRCPLAYDESFLSMATHKTILAVVTKLLGANFVLLQQNGVINLKNSPQYQVRWHRDLSYQHWTSSKPLVLNFLVALDRFSFEGGATVVLPGSHHYEKFPSDAYVRKYETCLEAEPGSVLIMDGMTFHRAGINTIAGFTRRALNHVVGLPFLAQQIDMPSLLKKRGQDFSQDAFLHSYLGYRWNPAKDVEAWRGKHITHPGKRD